MKNRAKVRSRVWLADDEGKLLFGAGRSRILKSIHETGSMSETAKQLGMSYRAVWGKIKATEEQLGIQLVTSCTGRRRGANTCLTPAAELLLERFDKLDTASRNFVDAKSRELFDFSLDDLRTPKEDISPENA